MSDAPSSRSEAATETSDALTRPEPPSPPMLTGTETEEQRQELIAGYVSTVEAYRAELEAWQAQQPVLSIQQIREVDDLATGPLYVPEWNGNVIIRGMTRNEYRTIWAQARTPDGVVDVEEVGRLAVATCLVEPRIEPDEPMFEKSPLALKRVIDAILERSGLTEEVRELQLEQFPD